MFDLAKKVALITGASRGLGWSMAQSLAKAGAHVVLNARDEKLQASVSKHSLSKDTLRNLRLLMSPILKRLRRALAT